MSVVGALHGHYTHRRRVRVLAPLLAQNLPPESTVLDVGCGDGLLSHTITECRSDVRLRGIDIIAREHTYVPVEVYPGRALPFESGSFDVTLFVDVLHHAEDPFELLREGARVCRRAVVIKDHLCEGSLDAALLRLMDRVGNQYHRGPLPHHYWRKRQWSDAFARLGFSVVSWQDRLGLYPPPASWVFERSLHFVARIDRT